ncbi:MAG: hypothetical protein GC191_09950 [Azospirillum sp.]|nr:hypothetical protein [Azospirillum sp.]
MAGLPGTTPETGPAGGTAETISDDAARWAAVLRHDPAADGSFFYAVRTTGVYCRPSCTARTPRRDNVSFYLSPAAAEAAGFRPCKRCHPAGPGPSSRKRVPTSRKR